MTYNEKKYILENLLSDVDEIIENIKNLKKDNYNIDDLKQELINYLTKKIVNDNAFNECDVEIIKILFENEKD